MAPLKAGIEILKAFLRPSERVDALSDPPPGPFNMHCTALDWKWREYSGTKYLSAFIPTHRAGDFFEAEQERAGCSFYVQKTGQKKKGDKQIPAADHQVLFCCLLAHFCAREFHFRSIGLTRSH